MSWCFCKPDLKQQQQQQRNNNKEESMRGLCEADIDFERETFPFPRTYVHVV